MASHTNDDKNNWEPLHREAHEKFIASYDKSDQDFEYWVTEHLRVSGYYWGYSGLFLLNKENIVNPETAIKNVMGTYHKESGGFGGNKGHDPHLLYTLSALQVLVLFDGLSQLPDTQKTVDFIASKQNKDGSFAGDEWGEVDTRFSYIAVNALSLLKRLDAIDVDAAATFILRCQNFDGAFGVVPGAESHAGQTFCCVGALSILKKLDKLDRDLLGWWLAERQLPEGGLNGRPQKLPDVCYSWWVLSALACIDRLHWINKQKLIGWILSCQDPERGGFADRPDDQTDIFHTFFGLAGLSLLGYEKLEPIDPSFALPVKILKKN
mmetsp:Transcript_10215/g.15396  ORF Transcript_10215/g.15396 Transcript_10215/m.15396 type:complete len:323 (+) Transcript_10215:412-1380(+)|eukprot:CAMPEP_0201561016 /NCGR_PEP_ID=MMETSP0173_2-20130828/78567_1 /ASSEMBLY_ACC=CAM_ASM_000268 /TAXON_ID=218659 /ORGANISM="Vexillifera sp., Strain DIVA3 564/2" /LENGTH=322 /DNA_ID=CAMNT_0047975483 /DNA_START=1129 /DNA_END=2097 /DNA_ORIENTATION=-